MARLLILFGILATLLWLAHWFRTTPAHQVAAILRKMALWGGLGMLLVAVATGHLNPLFAALGAAIPIIMRVTHLLKLLPMLQQALRALGITLGPLGEQDAGRIRTRYLELQLDPLTGALDALVLDGPFTGRRLSQLGPDERSRMLEFYRDSDPASAQLLLAWLARQGGGAGREQTQRGQTGGSHRLDKAEAWSVLGLQPNADPETIRAAHRRLIQRFHPDRGGSDYLAAMINEAKQVLLDE